MSEDFFKDGEAKLLYYVYQYHEWNTTPPCDNCIKVNISANWTKFSKYLYFKVLSTLRSVGLSKIDKLFTIVPKDKQHSIGKRHQLYKGFNALICTNNGHMSASLSSVTSKEIKESGLYLN